jgi:methylated-DNA-[protein]-cysteine S-methyltransferase
MSTKRYRIIDSPVGPLTLVGDDEALTGLRMDEQSHPPPAPGGLASDEGAFPEVVDQLTAYFAGELTEFHLTLGMEGTAFQRRVWSALVEIPYGETVSYGQLATQIGQPSASRAVGLANGRNPIAIIVPCHRVIGSTGALVGYGGGVDRKRRLLELERDHRAPRLAV